MTTEHPLALVAVAVTLAACGHGRLHGGVDGDVVHVTSTMTVTDLQAAIGGVGKSACSVVFGKRAPSGRTIRIEWNHRHLEGRIRCDAEPDRPMPEDAQINQAGFLFWEPTEHLFSIGSPSGPGREPLHPPLSFSDRVEAYWLVGNDPKSCRAIEATLATEFLNAFKEVVLGFERVSFPGLTAEQAACPCSFAGSVAERPSAAPWKPLPWIEVSTERPWKQVGKRWVACGQARPDVRILGASGWTTIGIYGEHGTITALAGDDAIVFRDKVWVRGRTEPVFDKTFTDSVSTDGTRIGRIECAGGVFNACTVLHLVERDPHGQMMRDWKVPVPSGEYLSEGFGTDGFYLVRYPKTHDHWMLARVERQGIVDLEPLPSDADWGTVFDRHRRWRKPLQAPKTP